MGAGRVVRLVLVMLLTMPRARAENCGEGEYFHEGLCCVFCEAGTFVADHCNASHLRGKCDPCKEGKDYTAHENGLEGCLLCRQCKDDQITVRPCTLTQDTECQCKQGYFCADEGCEICQRHSQMHPDGKDMMQNCNATTGLGCGLPNQGSRALAWVILVIVVVILGLLFFVFRKLKCDKAASPDKDAERGLNSEDCTESLILSKRETRANNIMNPEDENSAESPESQAQTSVNLGVENTSPVENSVFSEQGAVLHGGWKHSVSKWLRRVAGSSLPAKLVDNSVSHPNAPSKAPRRTPAKHNVRKPKCQIIVKGLSQRELRDTFEAFIKEVRPKQWRRLMRTHLQENDIDKVIYNYPKNIEEQCYQMLLIWRNTLGEKQCIIKLLDELRHIDTNAYCNISNTLKSNNIISEVEAAD